MADGGKRSRSYSESTIFPPKCPRGVLGGNTADDRTPDTTKVKLDGVHKFSQFSTPLLCDAATQYEPMISMSLVSTTVLCDSYTQTEPVDFCDFCDMCKSSTQPEPPSENLCVEEGSISSISDCQKLIRSFSCTVSKLEERIQILNNSLDSSHEVLSKLPVSTPVVNDEHNYPNNTHITHTVANELPHPMCIHEQKVNIDVNNILDNISFKDIGNRKVAYYGTKPYKYAGVHHPACDYPKLDFFDNILENMKLINTDFNLSEYTCTVTLLPNGDFDLPKHSDNEVEIEPGSTIYTACVGAERAISYTNRVGPLCFKKYQLPDGTIYSMSQESQSVWEHGISPEPEVNDPRISFTFRKIRNPIISYAPVPPIPPIRRPDCSKVPNARKVRILFLTDSIQAKFPCHLFKNNFVCIKKLLYKISDIEQYENEFQYSDYVIISSGINDLSRYVTPDALVNFLSPKIRQLSRDYPNTSFIFSSLLESKYNWLNQASQYVNKVVFNLSLNLKNMWFFDFWNLIDPYRSLDRRGNGVHITYNAQNLYTSTLIKCINLLHVGDPCTRREWPLRSYFKSVAASYRRSVGYA